MTGWQIDRFDEITSTQDIARSRVREGASGRIAIVAAAQTAGRGRNGNTWETRTGNLFLSFLLPLRIDLLKAGQYSFLVAVALNRAIRSCGISSVQNKWPNDVLIEGKKVAGILLEVEGQSVIVGMGVNIQSAPEGKICLHDAGVKEPTVDAFLPVFLDQLDAVLDLYAEQGFEPVLKEWLGHAVNLGKSITVRLPQSVLEGVFAGIAPDGALELRLANGEIKVIHSGEIFFEVADAARH